MPETDKCEINLSRFLFHRSSVCICENARLITCCARCNQPARYYIFEAPGCNKRHQEIQLICGMKRVLAGVFEHKNQHPGLLCDNRLIIEAETVARFDCRRMNLDPRVGTGIQESAAEIFQGCGHRFRACKGMRIEPALQAGDH